MIGKKTDVLAATAPKPSSIDFSPWEPNFFD